MSPADLRAWMLRNDCPTSTALARRLEVTTRTVDRWLAGESPIERRTVLALLALEHLEPAVLRSAP